MAAKPSLPQRLWARTGLTSTQVKLMIKGALPPTIGLAAYQATFWADTFTTLGYLICIMSLLSMPILPRAKFIQQMSISILFTCIAAALALLQTRCAIWARENTTRQSTPQFIGQSGSPESSEYNAAACTTAAVFLMVGVFVATITRAFRPALNMPTIQFSIFIVVSSVYAGTFASMSAAESFVRRLLIVFLTGFGLATGVSLLVFPMTSRYIVRAQMGGLIGVMKGILRAHESYIDAVVNRNEDGSIDSERCEDEAKRLHDLGNAAGEILGKVKLEASFARKEIAYGHLTPGDISKLAEMLRFILLPMTGISTFLNIVQAAGERRRAADANSDTQQLMNAMEKLDVDDWHDIFELSSEPYTKLQTALIGGLDHIARVFRLGPKLKRKEGDVEEEASPMPTPGCDSFAAYLKAGIHEYHEHRETVIQRWAEQKGVTLPATFWEDGEAMQQLRRMATEHIKSKGTQQQLYLQLFAEFIIHSMGNAILRLVEFADSKMIDGTLKKKRLINPGWHRLRKLMISGFKPKDTNHPFADDNSGAQIWIGDALKKRHDPEHLPPSTTYERVTDHFRIIPRLLASPQASFAFRAALAAISLGMLAFFRQTQAFFLEQRGLWSLIMVSIGMGAHTGVGIFGFVFRILGTVIAMVASIIIWYVGYKHATAIIPIMFIYLLGGWCFVIKNPSYAMVGLISMISGAMIVGYQLQSQKIGLTLIQSNGQVYYPIYIFAPVRLLAVVIGLSTAFIWTYFPYPVTTHATLRRDLGHGLYLLANYHACVHATIDLRMHYGIPRSTDSHSPTAKLDKARVKVLNKCILMLGRLREHSRFTRYEPQFGGVFPREKYDRLIDSMQKIFRLLSLIGYAANAFTSAPGEEESQWIKDFRAFTADIDLTSHAFTSTLCLVSSSILDAQPLPPYIHVLKPYGLGEKLSSLDPEILSLKNVSEPSYAAFAVLAVTTTLLSEEMTTVIKLVRELVGEVDFSFRITTAGESVNSSEESMISSHRTITVQNRGKED